MRDARYDILFEPVAIGPVVARNRFYQVPHCCGMGHRYPASHAAMRGMKAAGGWAVVCTEETEIHHTSDLSPFAENRIWDDQDLPALRAMTDAVHEHDALAGIELAHNGFHVGNHYSREVPLAPYHRPNAWGDPVQARAMDKADIADLRRWHRNAALRARDAGFDIVYVYAGHDLTVLQHFLSRRHNDRTDEYGGSLENRVRLIREILTDTREAVGDRCAVAMRFAVDELMGPDGITADSEGHDTVALLAELPDLWDVNVSDWSNDSQTARFAEEGYQEDHIRFVKGLTTKPVVGVGRYTSPDAMVRVVKQGVMDLIGAARPSIADPFLPRKIEQGRIEDIRECIGCNICVTGDSYAVPIRCTQNPTMGEEWRKGWHPEVIPAAAETEQVLVVGGGPAGLEAARACAARGLEVIVAEAGAEWGGRSAREARLPGLASWGRVKDWRLGQLQPMANAEMYLESALDAAEVLDYGIAHVAVATGATWRRDGVGRTVLHPVDGIDAGPLVTPDDVLDDPAGAAAAGSAGAASDGPVVVYDDDGYYMAGILAELFARAGRDVTLATPYPIASHWTERTQEHHRVQAGLMTLGVAIRPNVRLARRGGQSVDLACMFTDRTETIPCGTLVPVTARLPRDRLYRDLAARRDDWADAGIRTVRRIGDCLGPATIAAAVYGGHRYAREFGTDVDPDVPPFRREAIQVT